MTTLRTTIASAVEWRTRSLPPARQVRFGMVLAWLDRHDGDASLDVLDAGAGDAVLAERLARRRPRWRVVAVDLDDGRLEAARQRLASGGPANLAVRRGDLTGDLGNECFDVALAIECLVEIPNDDAALAAIARALRPGGWFVTHVPLDDWAPALPGSPARWRKEVRHGYSAAGLRAKLASAGLEVVQIKPAGRNMVFIGQEFADRLKSAPLRVRALTLPLTAGAAALERLHLTWGRPRAMFVSARRSSASF
jgi:SAM-dependent methyltransferase